MSRRTRWFLLLALSAAMVASSGCTSLLVRGEPTAAPELTSATVTRACPLGVPETRVRVADTRDGVDLLFETSPQRVDDVRRRLNEEVANRADAQDDGLRLRSLGEIRASSSPTSSGARLSLAPTDAARRDELRKRVIERVAELEARGCAT